MSDIVTWPYVLRHGHFDDPSQGACAMDAVNWLAHGRHGDAPECACPVIRAYVIVGNDEMPDDTRQRLLPFLHRIAGSRSEASEADRLRVFVLSAARVFTPRALDAAGLKTEAARLRALPDDASYETIKKAAKVALSAARVEVALTEVAEEMYATAEAAEEMYATAEVAAAQALSKATKEMYAGATEEMYVRAAAWRSARTAVWAARLSAQAWNDYFTVLDAALRAGPEGAPWSADAADLGARLYDGAGGLKTVYSEGVTG